MTDSEERYATVARGFERVLRAVEPQQWELATPCVEWNVTHLVAHVIATHRRVAATLSLPVASEAHDGADPWREWRDATTAIRTALHDPATASTVVNMGRGDRTFEKLVDGLLTIDTICHTWDLARATGFDERLDPVTVERCDTALRAVGDAIRSPEGFGPEIVPDDDADLQTRFLNFTGRRV